MDGKFYIEELFQVIDVGEHNSPSSEEMDAGLPAREDAGQRRRHHCQRLGLHSLDLDRSNSPPLHAQIDCYHAQRP